MAPQAQTSTMQTSMGQNKHEWMYVGMNNRVCTRERADAREERMTHICEVSPLHHAHPLMTHVNRSTARTVSSNDYTIIATLLHPGGHTSTPSTTCNHNGPNACHLNSPPPPISILHQRHATTMPLHAPLIQ